MYLICWTFWWPWRCAGAIQTTSPNASCPGLLRKPLDAGIGWLLAPYCPSGHQGNRQTNNNQQIHLKSWPFSWPRQCAGTLEWEIRLEFRRIPQLLRFRTFWTPEFSSEFFFSDRKMCSRQFWTCFFRFGILSRHLFFRFHESENIPAISLLFARKGDVSCPASEFIHMLF